MKNLEKYRTVLTGELDGLFLTSRYSRMYAAEFDISEGYAIVGKKGARYFTDSRYIESATNNIEGFEVIEFNREYPLSKALNDAIEAFEIKKLGYEEAYLTVAELKVFEEKLNTELTPIQSKIDVFRASKEPWEIDRMIKAQEITDKAFGEVIKRIEEGMSEKALAAELIYCLYKNGADGLSFDPIVVSGPNTSMPHGVPGERRIQKGDFITMDFGVIYQGYCSDMTRTVAFGYATEEMKEVYNTVLKAQLAGIAISKAGVSGKAIDEAARNVIAEAGFGEYFGHGYGHSLGLYIHEDPNCNPRNEDPMPLHAVASAEPGIYLPGKFGVRIEDVVIFEADGCRDITKSPKELLII
ncbi:MAG: aminopeptidase P family protein [Ruminococcaceae bacterium]|nr:aminopeptidase P family protein [Oscillospiraceae bacterium]